MQLGPVMLGLTGLALTPTEIEILQHPQTGGVILFTRNYQTSEQLKDLLHQIRAATPRHLLVAVDHEGGRIQRFREGFTQLPALGEIAKLYQASPTEAQRVAKQTGKLMAAELRAFDIDFSFAPVLDLDKGISSIIGDRAFHRDPKIVVELAKAYISGMRAAGMAAVGKHFPGHGSVAPDSHIAISVDSRTYEEIMADDGLPFAELIKDDLEGIMPAHIIYDQIDAHPTGFSRFWLQAVLRQRLGFQGAIFSDDLNMAGAAGVGNIIERARLALSAGCDCILICNDQADAGKVLEDLGKHPVKCDPLSSQRLLKFIGHNF
jgi:beta-N-acetylhexosaminidase